ncbi:hypothetical protein Mal4_32140 [Maioricimonas rarisocia]|uniref:Methyltransferase domain-containing protein n=1 Tax=Maioricimonas rarisocia TaxID=2528026 RepID=A0A517Z8S0_9PLAN|nr:class I SAM-dependent methyltransferase [Maioricimonas rarisocia]QDU38882.1 hypothetical protein Mal4_32140 [Maioricimonas rarisocia]
MNKSTNDEIRERFDAQVERFSNLESGQRTAIDSPLALDLITQAASRVTPQARAVLDVGCGAGNFTLKLLARVPGLDVSLIDLSQPMLDRAVERISAATTGSVQAQQGDVRTAELGESTCDVILAGAVLHHLRGEDEWEQVFGRFHTALRPGGSIWVFDLVSSSIPAVEKLMRERYGNYLTELEDEAFRDHVFDYIEKEDSPRPLTFQLDMLRKVGFAATTVLHRHTCFAAFGAVKN